MELPASGDEFLLCEPGPLLPKDPADALNAIRLIYSAPGWTNKGVRVLRARSVKYFARPSVHEAVADNLLNRSAGAAMLSSLRSRTVCSCVAAGTPP